MYEWIESTFGVSGGATQAIAVIIALAIVLLLFALFVVFLKKVSRNSAPQGRSRQPRIAVMDSAAVDTKRRLILVRRDNVEHLLLVGGPSDVVVEQQIIRNAPLSSPRTPSVSSVAPVVPQQAVQNLKSPMAPGPDIDQDDTVQTDDPAEPIQRVSPAPPHRPVTKAASEAPRLGTPDNARALAASGAISSPASATASMNGTRGEPDGPLANARRASKPVDPAPAKTNSFEHPAGSAVGTSGRDDAKSMPDIIPGQSSQSEAVSAPPSGETGLGVVKTPSPAASPRPLAKPFLSADRPKYGSQSITPPASGPAARAKTAFLQPAAVTDPGTPELEPAAPKPGSMVTASDPAEQDPAQTDSLTSTPDKQASASSDKGKASAAAPDKKAAQEISSDEALVEDEPKEPIEAPAAKTDAAEQEASAEKTENDGDETKSANQVSEISQLAQAPEVATQCSGETAAEDAAPSVEDNNADKKETSLDLDDLLGTLTGNTGPEPAGKTRKAPEIKVEPRPAAPVRTQGLADKNPIEDEMAKILDELGGQRP